MMPAALPHQYPRQLSDFLVLFDYRFNEFQLLFLPQRDKLIDEIHRLEGLMAYAESHGEWERLEELKARLKAAIDRMP